MKDFNNKIDMIKNDPSNIMKIDHITKLDYEELYDHYEKELNNFYENVKNLSRIAIAKNPYDVEYLYSRAENICMESLRLSTELLRTLKIQTDSMSIK